MQNTKNKILIIFLLLLLMYPKTERDIHFAELKALLESIAPDLVSDFYLKVVHTWEELSINLFRTFPTE